MLNRTDTIPEGELPTPHDILIREGIDATPRPDGLFVAQTPGGGRIVLGEAEGGWWDWTYYGPDDEIWATDGAATLEAIIPALRQRIGNWPPHYIDPDTGQQHDWNAIADTGDGSEPPLTYHDLVMLQAEATGQDMTEYFATHGYGDDEPLSPSYMDDDW